jgi:hypothetical protein
MVDGEQDAEVHRSGSLPFGCLQLLKTIPLSLSLASNATGRLKVVLYGNRTSAREERGLSFNSTVENTLS